MLGQSLWEDPTLVSSLASKKVLAEVLVKDLLLEGCGFYVAILVAA